MAPPVRFVVLLVALLGNCLAAEPSVSAYDVTWTSLGRDENDSMPIGNGDLAANVWTEENGDLVLLISKADAWTELNKLAKLGRVRLRLTPNPFAGAPDFRQTLHLQDATIEIRAGADVVRVWVDANRPVLHVSARLERPTSMRADVELWRNASHPYDEVSPDRGGLFGLGKHSIPVDFGADTVVAEPTRLTWLHFNEQSLFPIVLRTQHLESLAPKYPDPLLHRCFGATLAGDDWAREGDRSLSRSASEADLELTALTTTDTASPQACADQIAAVAEREREADPAPARAAHEGWWSEFWNRSWIHVTGSAEADQVSQGFSMQRYMMAASSRGAFPTKFNGGLFTVGRDVQGAVESTAERHNPDFRAWGGSYWNQNNRLLYWPLIQTGDFDLMRPWFDLYVKALPLALDRTRAYFHHSGAAFIETMDFWGLPNPNDFGWENPDNELVSRWMRYHTQGGLEVVAQMLDVYDITQDEKAARDDLVPLADALVAYHAAHWRRTAGGRIRMSPAQSLETYQHDVVNPTPDIAALSSVLPRLLKLPRNLTSAGQRASWRKVLRRLPPIPLGRTSNGKSPPSGRGDLHGKRIVLPAQRYGRIKNMENPELYVVFPYRLYGLGKAGLTLARDTFAARLFPQDTCWGQDGFQAAMLGLTEVAQAAAVHAFTSYGDQRFQWFWKPAHDWIPDLDNGGGGMLTLESMLMQVDGRRILLLPAWPADWSADFKLHAPYRTTVAGHVEHGVVANLTVVPESRKKDVTVLH